MADEALEIRHTALILHLKGVEIQYAQFAAGLTQLILLEPFGDRQHAALQRLVLLDAEKEQSLAELRSALDSSDIDVLKTSSSGEVGGTATSSSSREMARVRFAVPGWIRAMGEAHQGSFAAFDRDAGLKAPTGRTGRRSSPH